MPRTETCALCLNPTKLRESHIISKFLWRQSGVIGYKKTYSAISPTHSHLNEPHRQDGIKEKLLCHTCEQRFSRYEKYAAGALFEEGGPLLRRPERHLVLKGLDYACLKLFQMSILWRMGISLHPFYRNVQLGKHEETLRRMLDSEDPGEPWQYGCLATLINYAGQPLRGMISQPTKTKKFGHYCYCFSFAGMHWHQFATSHSPSKEILECLLLTAGTWVLFVGEATDLPDLRIQLELYRSLHQQ